MTEEEIITPAGGDEGADAPVEYSIDDAAAKLMDFDNGDHPSDGTDAGTPIEPTQEADGLVADELPIEQPEEPTNVEPDPSVIDWEKVPGTAKFRLRDGTEFDGAFVKQNLDRLRQVDRVEQELSGKYQQFQQHVGQIAQKEQQLSQLLPQAIQVLQQNLPQPPQPPQWDPNDLWASQEAQAKYISDKAAYDQHEVQIQQMQRVHAQQMHAQQQQEMMQHKDWLKEQEKALVAKIPGLRDPKKIAEFGDDHWNYGQKAYGFTPQELKTYVDHRFLVMARDAIAYRKLVEKGAKPQAAKPAAPQQGQRPVVAAPGAAQSPQAQSEAKRQELFSKARRKGGFSDLEAAEALSKLGL